MRPTEITIERRFDVTENITENWFRSYVSEVAKYGQEGKGRVNCEVRLGSDFENHVEFSDRAAWGNYVTDHWIDVAQTVIWQSEGILRRAQCHHWRHHVVLMLVANNVPDIEQTFALLRKTLSLTDSPENPYRYRRSSLEFEIGAWRPDWFVDGIKAIADLLGPHPEVPEAFAKSFDGDIEKLTPFFDLKSFCDNVGRRASLFEEIAIRMQARSIGVGVSVTSDHRKLRIRTSLPTDKIDPLVAAWPEKLKLKPIKATDPGAGVGGAAPVPSENAWLKYGIPVLVALVTALSTAGLINLKKAIWPDYKVTITSPFVQNGIAKWSQGPVSIDWYLQPERASFGGVKKDAVATVKIYSGSSAGEPFQAKPPVLLQKEPGTYVVVVDAAGAEPAQFQLILEKPPQ